MRPPKTLLLAPLALLAFLPSSASAAVVSMSSSSGPAASTFVDYAASSGEANNLVVRKSGRFLFFTDKGARRLVAKKDKIFGDCVKTAAQTARCDYAPLVVSLRDGNDRVAFRYSGKGDDTVPTDPLKLADPFEDSEGGFLVTTIVDGGPGDDVIGGTPFADSISPGPGADRVNAGGGADTVNARPDGKRDVLKGDAGLNALDYFSAKPIQIDTLAGFAGQGAERDVIRGFRRISGGSGNDTLRGGDAGEAIYGAGGSDDIDGRGGDDYLAGDIPVSFPFFSDKVAGGEGDDVIDVRDSPLRPTSTVDCGPGTDRVNGQEDDKVTGCESSARQRFSSTVANDLGSTDWETLTPIAPVSRGADGAPTYDIPCPGGDNAKPCVGSVILERAPTGTATPDQLGFKTFSIPAGTRVNVTVALNPAGVAALASPGAVLSIHVVGTIQPPASPPGQSATRFDYGWQTTF